MKGRPPVGHGIVCLGLVRHGSRGQVRKGKAWQGWAGYVCRGTGGRVELRHGRLGTVGPGQERLIEVWHGRRGDVW